HCDDLRLIAVLQALLRFVYLVGKASFRTAFLLADVQRALDRPDYRLSQLRYDLGKLRGKDLVRRVPKTQSYQLTSQGYQIAILFYKLSQRLNAPPSTAIPDPFDADRPPPARRRAKLDRLYSAVQRALSKLSDQVGLAA